MTVIRHTARLSLACAVLLGGCVSVPREAGFSDVRANVAERTGGKRVVWNQGTEADAAVVAEVRTLLQTPLTADSAVQIAMLNNRGLQGVYENLAIAQADLVAAGLLSNPVFDAEVRFPEGGAGAGAELSILQNFFDILYLPLRQRLAGAAFEAAKLRVTGAVLDLAGETRAAFYDLQAAQQTLEFRRQVVTATGASFDLARRLRRAGNITQLDLANERALYEQSKVNLAAAEAQVLQSREELNTLMGVWGAQVQWTVAGRLPELPAEAVASEGLEQRAVANSLDLGAARREIEVAGRAAGMVSPFGMFSDAEVGVSGERESGGDIAAGPAISVPIPLFNQGQPAIAAAQARLRRARQEYAALAVEIRSRVRAAYSAVNAAAARAEYYRRVLLPLREKIVGETLLQYNAMQIGAFELLVAKQQQIDTANEYIEALREYWLARTELDLILSGRLARIERPEPGASRSAVPLGPGAPEGDVRSGGG